MNTASITVLAAMLVGVPAASWAVARFRGGGEIIDPAALYRAMSIRPAGD